MKIWLTIALFLQILVGQNLKVVAVDWTAAEILSSVGYEPTAIGDLRNYATWVKEPKMSQNVIDLGLRIQPNLESLLALKPDIIIVPSFFSFNQKALDQHARVVVIDAYKSGDTYENILLATRQIAQLVGHERQADELISKSEQFFAKMSEQMAKFRDQPVAIVQFVDKKHVRIYGRSSIYGAALEKMGLKNAVKDEFGLNLWGIATIQLTSLFTLPANSRLVIIEPNPVDIAHEIKFNGLYRSLKILENYVQIEPVWSAGAMVSMQRFASTLQAKFQDSQNLGKTK